MKFYATLTFRLKHYLENYKTRHSLRVRLRGMPANELDRLAWDIGKSRTELLREAHSPFWKTRCQEAPYLRQNGLCASSERLP